MISEEEFKHYLTAWPQGTNGYRTEKEVIEVLFELGSIIGFGRLSQLTSGIEKFKVGGQPIKYAKEVKAFRETRFELMGWKDGVAPIQPNAPVAASTKKEEKEETVPVNIWDDYYEDGYVPDGEIQETYIYVEDKSDHEFKKKVLESLLEYINNNFKKSEETKFWIEFYDSRAKYPDMDEKIYHRFHFQRWEIKAQHLTHEQRERLVKELEVAKIKVDGKSLNVYSES